jgi:hypothetical protein
MSQADHSPPPRRPYDSGSIILHSEGSPPSGGIDPESLRSLAALVIRWLDRQDARPDRSSQMGGDLHPRKGE